jgi:hypothetical protein
MSEYPGVNWRLKEYVENDNVCNGYVCLVCIENTQFCIDSFSFIKMFRLQFIG